MATMKKQLFLLLIILSTTTHLHAATFTWLGTTSSDFNLASNWSGGGGGVPFRTQLTTF
jgi:hypothetical protein